LLFNRLADADPLLVKAKGQHESLRTMASLIAGEGAGNAQLTAFADLLEEHIRFEERELFGHIEATVSLPVMEEIGQELEALHASRRPLIWADEFWIRQSL
jgi:hypothetical protein